MKTNLPIHSEWLGQTETRFYSWKMAGYIIHIEADGTWQGERVDCRKCSYFYFDQACFYGFFYPDSEKSCDFKPKEKRG